ncbi:PQQ-dependent sugar dehydrogenase [Aurantiacibacter gilvus]|uniref:PQQ-dependent sugar dehydrogenase n=1 Tax=Aurantiacibacter gilvus TaxID=3139141 RepID=A0ABU9IBR0_9SPHN
MRKTILSTALFASALGFASCSHAQSGDGDTVELGEEAPFTATSYGTFAAPWAIAFEPGTGRIFLTEKAGTIKFVAPATGTVGAVDGAPEVLNRGQGGLGDIAFAPDYAESGTVYITWAQPEGEGALAAMGRGTLVCHSDTHCELEDFSEIWRQSHVGERFGHYSHKIAFSPDGEYLFLASGDRQEGDPAQDLMDNRGAVLRLNLDGTAAEGNPFAEMGSPADQIWSYGQRNLLGFEFAPDGNLWDLEHGPAGGDELNLVVRGANYGWPVRSNGDNYDGSDIPDHTEDDGFTKPAIFWNPVIAPSDMIFYTGDMFADWQGQLLVTTLRTTAIARISVDAEANSAGELARYTMPTRLRSIAEAPDGAIWVAEDGGEGRLLRLTPAN